jgi:two-component system, LuxR family, sensor kinase FixL
LQADLVHIARVSAMDEMGAALAHELNQPLTAIMLYLQAATRTLSKAEASGAMPGATFRQVLDKAVHEAERAGSIISRMRHFVEKRDPHRKVVNLNAVVEEAVELTVLGQRNAGSLRRDFAQNLPHAVVDPVQIQQVVVNLLRNAFEAVKGRSDAIVTVRTGRTPTMLTVTIEDTGPGLPPSMLPNLFKAFSTSKRTGMGLGLSISRTIAQNHAGDLTVDPGGDGRGASFSLHLPIATLEGGDDDETSGLRERAMR